MLASIPDNLFPCRLPRLQIKLEDIVILDKIGCGDAGTVFEATIASLNDGEKVALKVFKPYLVQYHYTFSLINGRPLSPFDRELTALSAVQNDKEVNLDLPVIEAYGVTSEISFTLGVAYHYYFLMVNEYTLRGMSYPSDRLSGFQGILNFYNMKYGPVFTWGMWSGEILVHSLLWQPQHDLARIPINDETKVPIYPSWSWAGWSGPVKYSDYLDCNGLPTLKDPWKRALQSEYGETIDIKKDGKSTNRAPDPTYYLHLHTRIASFRLTLDNRSGTPRPTSLSKAYIKPLTQFGITTVRPADFGTEEEWLGTILLPESFRQNLSEEHEFVVLSSAYCFVSDELSLDVSSALKPYAAMNVILITRQGKTLDGGKPIVVRAGVGRMLKKAWDRVEVCWEDMLVA